VLEGVGIKVQDEIRRPVFKFAASDPTDLHSWTFAQERGRSLETKQLRGACAQAAAVSELFGF
jgi:hypothetical protein